MNNEHRFPNNVLLVTVLWVITMKGNCAPKDEISEALQVMGVHDGKEHRIPRGLLTKVWVQEQYLEYMQVRNSEPARYEFLWGPRAHAETTKLKVLEFLAQINGSDPRSFPHWYEGALREEEQRARARISTTDDPTAMASASSSAKSIRFFCPQ